MSTYPPASNDSAILPTDVLVCPFNPKMSDRWIARMLAHNYQSVLSGYFLEHPDELEVIRHERIVVVARANTNETLAIVRKDSHGMWYADQVSTVQYSNVVDDKLEMQWVM